MDVLSAIQKRREITAFKDAAISEEDWSKLKTALYQSPAGNNLPSREFIMITNKKLLEQLSKTTPYMRWLEQAAAGVAIIGNEELSKYWLQDASIAGGYLWLAATSLGLGAAWGAVYHSEDHNQSAQREKYVRDLLGIPAKYRVVAILGLGYPASDPPPKEMYAEDTVFHLNSFNTR
ncbi:nitroreductase [Paenibacillus lentus]|uniref:Nitroreductase n=2 Tax=Paenibacillus lentus TaxID=1338368 RepID=A0A3Q8S7H0_9BACL|nr:nitroreductase family protein [Paenibacillus lentus]AZK48951.1 nitroreductase [Paenibacillus lentus]